MLPLSLSEITESKQEIAKIFFKKNGFVHFDLRIVLTVYLKMPPTSASQVTRLCVHPTMPGVKLGRRCH